MHALEDEPEKKNRWRRLVSGLGIAVALAAGMLFAAQKVGPARRLMPEILQLAIVDEPPKPPKQLDLPPPPPPPPPPPKAPPRAKDAPHENKSVDSPPPDQQRQEPQQEPEAGLDATSFAAGGNGVSFHAGNTQMGDPNHGAKRVIEAPKLVDTRPPKLSPARAINPELPDYPERARRLNIQGSVLLEADIDERGGLVALRVRQSLEHGLDEIAMASVKKWRFQPASLGGRFVPSTRVIRIRFELD
jgi:protein TonB